MRVSATLVRVQVVARALELLFVCCSAVQCFEEASTDTYTSMLAAATAAAHAHDEQPFAIVVAHLACDEIEVKLNALTLINCLLSAASGWVPLRRLVYSLEQLGCNLAVINAGDVRDERFQQQLELYAEQVRPTPWPLHAARCAVPCW